ncbi:histidine phosphatase family protein [Plantibacter sp. Mn2098]|uniref:histidine phosphatase family protein n=1 Tax=Plantibacter sp. Mn2098 TaxID=3395266 RepID=UPI003BBC6068
MTDPDSATRHIYLARHGRTALNAEGRLRGLADPELDPAGIAEAKHLAQSLASKTFSLVLSSPLQRATRTAAIIAETADVPHRADARLTDRDYGPWTGHRTEDVLTQWGMIDDAPGVESVQHVLERVLPALDAIVDETRSVVIVTHDAVIRPIITSIEPTEPSPAVPTASWSELTRTNGHWHIVSTDQH